MLTKYADRVLCYFAIDYPPDFGDGVMRAARELNHQFAPEVVAFKAPFTYLLRWPKKRRLLTVSHQRTAFVMADFGAWCEQSTEHLSMIHSSLKQISPATVKRVGFKVVAWIPLQMSHAELCDLFFNSLLANRDELEQVFGQSLDPLVQMEGKSGDLGFVNFVSPVTTEQASKAVQNLPDFSLLFDNPRLDPGQSDFHERVTAEDCLWYDIDLFQSDIASVNVEQFVHDSIATARRIANNVVNRLLAKPLVDEER